MQRLLASAIFAAAMISGTGWAKEFRGVPPGLTPMTDEQLNEVTGMAVDPMYQSWLGRYWYAPEGRYIWVDPERHPETAASVNANPSYPMLLLMSPANEEGTEFTVTPVWFAPAGQPLGAQGF